MNKGLVAAVVVIVVLIGATGYLAYRNLSTTSTPGNTKITFTGWVSSGEEYTFDLQMVNAFNHNFTNVTAIFQPYTQNYYAQLSTAFTSNSAPSIFYMENDILPLFASSGYLMNMTSVLQSNSTYDLSGFAQPILHTFYYKGGLYAAPKDWGPLLMYYNKAIFDQEKIPYPGNTTWNWTSMLSTLHQLSASASLLNATMKTIFAPMVMAPSIAWALAFIHEAGGQWINQTGNGFVTNSQQLAGFKTGLQFYYNLSKEGAQLSANFSAGWAGGDFAANHIGMITSGLWTVPVLEAPGSNFYNNMGQVGYFDMPAGKQKGTMMFNVGLAVNSKLTGSQKWAAEQFLQFFTGPPGEKQWVSNGLALPARATILNSTWYKTNFPIQAFAGDQFPFAFGWNYNTTNFNTVHNDVNTIYADLFAGNYTFNQAFNAIVNKTNSDLKNSSTFATLGISGKAAFEPVNSYMDEVQMSTAFRP